MASLLADILSVPITTVGTQTSFFSLGGDSIRAITVAARCRDHGISIAPIEILSHPTIEEMLQLVTSRSEFVSGRAEPSAERTVPEEVVNEAHAAYSTRHGLGSEDLEDIFATTMLQTAMVAALLKDKGSYLLQQQWRIKGVVDVERMRMAWESVIVAHGALRTGFFVGEKVWQVVVKPEVVRAEVNVEEWDADAEEEVDRRVAKFWRDDQERGFECDALSLGRLSLAVVKGTFSRFCSALHPTVY